MIAFFSLHPQGVFSVPIQESGWDITPYANLWSGLDWLEIGTGVRFYYKNLFSANLNVGITNAFFLSNFKNSLKTTLKQKLIVEGGVVNLKLTSSKSNFESEIYVAYYLSLRSTNAIASGNILHISIQLGYSLSPIFILGVHVQLMSSSLDSIFGASFNWFGIYKKIKLTNNLMVIFLGGIDTSENSINDFYKASIAIFF